MFWWCFGRGRNHANTNVFAHEVPKFMQIPRCKRRCHGTERNGQTLFFELLVVESQRSLHFFWCFAAGCKNYAKWSYGTDNIVRARRYKKKRRYVKLFDLLFFLCMCMCVCVCGGELFSAELLWGIGVSSFFWGQHTVPGVKRGSGEWFTCDRIVLKPNCSRCTAHCSHIGLAAADCEVTNYNYKQMNAWEFSHRCHSQRPCMVLFYINFPFVTMLRWLAFVLCRLRCVCMYVGMFKFVCIHLQQKINNK